MQLWSDFLGKKFPQFHEIRGKCFNRVVNVENVLRPVFVVACVLDQNLLRHKGYWICHLHLLRRCEWVSVGLTQTYVPRCEQQNLDVAQLLRGNSSHYPRGLALSLPAVLASNKRTEELRIETGLPDQMVVRRRRPVLPDKLFLKSRRK
jgi:hypothetical protein